MFDFRDFGGDATDGKCQVRFQTWGECPNKAKFLFDQNFTTRAVCESCLSPAVRFVLTKTKHVTMIRKIPNG